MRTAAIIPARFASTRFPGKPLALIGGEPMIAHVVRRVLESEAVDEVCVATDSSEIAAAAERAGARAVMTSPTCETGTDRVAEAAAHTDAGLILNVQGDEPMLPPGAVRALRAALEAGAARGIDLATLARPLRADEAGRPQVVKVVLAEDSTALYFSRSLVPYPRAQGRIVPLAHVGLYGYTRAALAMVARLPPTALEQAESLEQLRFLGHGHRIQVAVGDWHTHAVDTPEDLVAVRRLLEGDAAFSGA